MLKYRIWINVVAGFTYVFEPPAESGGTENNMTKKIRTEEVNHLFEAILTLENAEECYQFFEDICTVNELLSIAQRFEVASMLRNNNTYIEISENTGASTATISRVNRSLNYGNDGYDMVFRRIKENKENKE